ncbi:hypothetical protein DFH08DRAFT_943050 [Mycena albidolilacea]|uniref:Uncharacterized protein n=1 Tax=Mycena albidolilacea TaxID=1033008 RepID=A0AAD6ZBW1_9AGAR|nr:hypothetical protein DFH08DRAFT_943050 [Mycena albidolilacea]
MAHMRASTESFGGENMDKARSALVDAASGAWAAPTSMVARGSRRATHQIVVCGRREEAEAECGVADKEQPPGALHPRVVVMVIFPVHDGHGHRGQSGMAARMVAARRKAMKMAPSSGTAASGSADGGSAAHSATLVARGQGECDAGDDERPSLEEWGVDDEAWLPAQGPIAANVPEMRRGERRACQETQELRNVVKYGLGQEGRGRMGSGADCLAEVTLGNTNGYLQGRLKEMKMGTHNARDLGSQGITEILRLSNLQGLRHVEINITRVCWAWQQQFQSEGWRLNGSEQEPGVTGGGAGKSFGEGMGGHHLQKTAQDRFLLEGRDVRQQVRQQVAPVQSSTIAAKVAMADTATLCMLILTISVLEFKARDSKLTGNPLAIATAAGNSSLSTQHNYFMAPNHHNLGVYWQGKIMILYIHDMVEPTEGKIYSTVRDPAFHIRKLTFKKVRALYKPFLKPLAWFKWWFPTSSNKSITKFFQPPLGPPPHVRNFNPEFPLN